jgi:hypothetical protein
MRPSEMLQVLTDAKGRIIAAGVLTSGRTHETEVQIRITPLEGQSLREVPFPDELGKLEASEDFRRLAADFYLPRGKKELTRRRAGREPKKRRSRPR